ncbi:MAG TPA: BadF/BadG/BcrA/BcrD ATPase family protein [Acidobacteriota bacterium]|nr:BadF/BadG/BcrA/BcrD ATPase family protein [Acidobacteriota bacterium]
MGIDGGASRTVCLVADLNGAILGRGRGGPSNYHKCGLYAAKVSVRDALASALLAAGRRVEDVEVVCAGLAGVARPLDRELFSRAFAELARKARLILEDDARVALAGATENRPGIIVICGTGSIAMGMDGRGGRARAGGWGHLLGDEGSGYDIARRGLAAALKSADGRGPSTSLRQKIRRELYLDSLQDLIPVLYGERVTPDRIASLFPLVLEAAEEGDQVSRRLLREAASELIDSVAAVSRQLHLDDSEPLLISASGGAWQSADMLRKEFLDLLPRRLPQARFQQALRSPEEGAVLLALAELD